MSFPDGRDRLIEQLLAYIPYNEQEEKDRDEILRWLDDDADIFKRRNAAWKEKMLKKLKGDTENDRFRTMNSMRSVDAQAGIYLLGR